MKRIYLISGSYIKQGFENDISNYLKNDIKEEYILSFIPTKFDEIEKNKERLEKILNWFKEKNITFSKSFIIDNNKTEEESKEILKKSSVIFLTGGDTLKQIKGIEDLNIKNDIKNNGKIIIGLSAGAINLGTDIILTKDEEDNIPNTITYQGIGLTNINIEPHCDFNNKEHWNDLLVSSYKSEIICMKDNCSIIIENKKTKILGNYCIIKNGKIIKNNL